MEREREEIYERIPWETLERRSGDRQWMVYAVAGAVTLGALAYSFTRNQGGATIVTTVPAVSTLAEAPSVAVPAAPQSTVASPVVVSEADLFAVDPERLVDRVAAHAEWFAVEYLAVDGSEQSQDTLASLLPAGLPTPLAPEGTQVFVDWARASQVTQTGPLDYQVEVLVRSLVSTGDGVFTRQPARLLTVGIRLTGEGEPRVSGVPAILAATPVDRLDIALLEVPDDVAGRMDPARGEVLGGLQGEDGSWQVVIMETGSDGVSRPTLVSP